MKRLELVSRNAPVSSSLWGNVYILRNYFQQLCKFVLQWIIRLLYTMCLLIFSTYVFYSISTHKSLLYLLSWFSISSYEISSCLAGDRSWWFGNDVLAKNLQVCVVFFLVFISSPALLELVDQNDCSMSSYVFEIVFPFKLLKLLVLRFVVVIRYLLLLSQIWEMHQVMWFAYWCCRDADVLTMVGIGVIDLNSWAMLMAVRWH